MKTNRNQLVDVLKGIGCIAVILLHVGFTTEQTQKAGFPFWCVFAVPMFMFLSGYVNALSMNKKKTSFKEYYSAYNLFAKLLRFAIPYIMAFAIEVAYFVINHQTNSIGGSVLGAFIIFLKGGVGPGSYYMPIMVQFILLFPILYYVVKKYKLAGLWISAGINILFEILQSAGNMDPEIYRLLCFRYTFIIGLGVYTALGYDFKKIELKHLNKKVNGRFAEGLTLFLAFFVGVIFIVVTSYGGYKPVIFNQWTTTSFPACLYIGAILYLVMKNVKVKYWGFLATLGKASFNIFLTQMVWYAAGFWFIQSRAPIMSVMTLTSIIVSIMGGIIFYHIENPLTTMIVEDIKESRQNRA